MLFLPLLFLLLNAWSIHLREFLNLLNVQLHSFKGIHSLVFEPLAALLILYHILLRLCVKFISYKDNSMI